jgi:hypothetical protein
MKRIVTIAAAGLCACAAQAEPFWISYDAACGQFPEEVGSDRLTHYGGDQRSFQDGSLVLDGLASPYLVDNYGISRPIELGPGETLVMEWRLRVDEVDGLGDPAVSLWSQGHGTVTLLYAESALYSLYDGTWTPFAPGVFHDYLLTSADLSTFALYIDGVASATGCFVPRCPIPGSPGGTRRQGRPACPNGLTSGSGWFPNPAPACSWGPSRWRA